MKRKLDAGDVAEAGSEGAGEATSQKAATFADLNLDPRLLQALRREKFAAPTPVQRDGIALALAGKDMLARAKTGSGKTLAYLLPILHLILKRKGGHGEKKKVQETSALVLVPTRELASQVTETLKTFTAFCGQEVRYQNISRTEDAAVTKARLVEKPDVVVGTPGKTVQWLNSDHLSLTGLKWLVIDEADLVLSYGYEDDLSVLAAVLTTAVQKLLLSATLRTEVDTLTSIFFPSGTQKPTVLDLSREEAADRPTLSQYIVRTAEDDKFLLIYTLFKLQLISGKVIMFVADVDRCYRVKLFLEQFGVRSCVLNSELPLNSRLHAVEEFNRGVYDIIIAADENEVVGEEAGSKKRRKVGATIEDMNEAEVVDGESEKRRKVEATIDGVNEVEVVDGEGKKKRKVEATVEEVDDAELVDGEHEQSIQVNGNAEGIHGDEDASKVKAAKVKQLPKKRRRGDREFTISRGIDFRHVACVLNFDLPTTSKSYTHRIGRTARAGQTGMALSFYVPKELYRKHKPTSIPQCKDDEEVLSKIRDSQEKYGRKVESWEFDMKKLEGFRYRLTDALRSVTRIAVREARTKELRAALISSEKLKRHFEENPDDLRHLRHDVESHAVKQQPHLKHVPDYLLPAGGKAAVTKDVGFVRLRKEKDNSLRKRREFNQRRGRGRTINGKGMDPLKLLNARGRGKK